MDSEKGAQCYLFLLFITMQTLHCSACIEEINTNKIAIGANKTFVFYVIYIQIACKWHTLYNIYAALLLTWELELSLSTCSE